MPNLTKRSLDLFLALARDAANWSGCPMIGGNVGNTKEEREQNRGNITQLKKEGLITTFTDRGDSFVEFTEEGKKLAQENGITIEGGWR